MKKKRRILGRALARTLSDEDLVGVHGGACLAREPDYTPTRDPKTGEEID